MQQSLISLLTYEFFIPILLCHRLYISIIFCRLFFNKLLYIYLIRLQTEYHNFNAEMICIWLEKYIITFSKYQSVIILFRVVCVV